MKLLIWQKNHKKCPARFGIGKHKDNCYLRDLLCNKDNCPFYFWLKAYEGSKK